nr:PREDICTED: putative Polycomb group protein ASXL1 isoform X1 [Anolis carolinensis]|eukprot:XP_008119066.1 PREDICTED: putative Polycomb group protein ASXL1 isoform X1 [Anolis carolinensis]
MREMKQRRKKERTWAEAARLVLENHSDGPMTPKQILQVIETEGLKEMRSGTSPLACLNAMLHSNSRSCDGLFYKLPGRISLFTLKKDAVQWSRSLSAPEGEEADDADSSGSNEAASTVSGDNDVSLDETSSNASCSTETQSKTGPILRESHRVAAQASKQKKKAGVMLPRVVLTPLKVNGAHMETSSGFPGKHVVGESSSGSSSALCSTAGRSRTEIARDPPQLFRGFRKPSGGQMKRNRGDDIDFETPGSILVNTNLRALINCRTFNALPLHFQQQLLLLLPEVDRQPGTDGLMRLSGSALNNEFFALAAQSWRERLADGEFTHEMQVRIRQEMEKEKKTEQWKEKFFEDYYGQKLGLTREDPQPQNSVPNEVEKKSAPAPEEAEPVRVQRGPVTRQRDGHFKKRPLRCRSRRNLYKLQEPKQAKEASEALPPVEPEPTDSSRDTKPEVDPPEKRQVSPERESAPEATRVPSKAENLVAVAAPPATAAAATAERIPILPQEAQEQESKEQKRKCFEQAASPSFPEKKPRLEDRQSFRNTIESVHPEKPQPTKEEPKVPPIRIQLSRIKPPWVVKGQPAYQICPRIIPNPEPSGQDRSGPPATADFKACALQGRLQREAAAPPAAPAAATAIGGGGGPGGGQRGTDEGGGGGGDSGGGHNSRRRRRRRRVRQTGRRPGRWRPKRTRGKCVPDLQRAQLLPPSQLEGQPAFEPAKPSSPTCEGEASFAAVEGERVFRVAADLTSLGCEDAAQLSEASMGSPFDGTRTEPTLDCSLRKVPAGRSEPLEEISSGQALGAVLQAERELPSNNQMSHSWQEDSPVNLLGDTNVVEEEDGATPVTLNCNTSTVKGTSHISSYATGLALESSEEKTLEAFGSCRQEHFSLPENTSTPGAEDLAQPFHISQWHSRERPSEPPSCDTGEAPLWKPKAHTEDSDPPQERFALKSCLLTWEASLETRTETDDQPAEAVVGTNPFLSDEETRSGLSETTETASDLEAELTDDNADDAAEDRAAPGRGHLVLKSECSMKTETSTHIDNLPSQVGTTRICLPQGWKPQPSLPQEDHQPSVCLDLKKPEKTLRAASRPLSIEASNPLVVQLLRGSLPLQAVLPGSCSISRGAKPVSSPDKLSAVGNKSSNRHSRNTSRDKGVDANGRVRNGYDMYNCLRDSSTKQSSPVPIHLKKEPKGLEEETSELNPNSQSVRAVRVPWKPDDDALDLRKGTLSSGASKEPKGSPTDLSGRNPEEMKAAPATPLSSCVTSLGPAQPSGDSVSKSQGTGGKKVFGPGFPCGAAPRAQHPQMREAFPMLSMLSHSKSVSAPAKNAVPEDSVVLAREDWPTKPRLRAAGSGGVENKRVPPGPGPAKRNGEKRKETELMMEQLQALPLARDLSFFRLPREPGKGLAQPLEPSSIPSQLNIKQSFYGKLSKLQLNAPSLSYTSAAPVFPRSLMGSMTALGPKANFAASRSAQMFVDGSRVEEISLKCSCSLKAMIMCKGCGAFCHDDCIGPSKLCVLCLVVR